MTEQQQSNEEQKTYPLTFDVFIHKLDKINVDQIYIGNSGLRFDWRDGSIFFEQHYNPDRSWYKQASNENQLKYTVIYARAFWKFLQWLNELENTDPKKAASIIKGATNETMSNIREKLFGEAYSSQRIEGSKAKTGPLIKYKINLDSLKTNENLMKKLKKISKRAANQDYTTITPPPEKKIISSIITNKANLK